MFSKKIFKKINYLSTSLAKARRKNILIENYKKGEITLDHYTNDLRPFYWHNFKTNKEIFKIKETRFDTLVFIRKLGSV